jgi:hypothetical protein
VLHAAFTGPFRTSVTVGLEGAFCEVHIENPA